MIEEKPKTRNIVVMSTGLVSFRNRIIMAPILKPFEANNNEIRVILSQGHEVVEVKPDGRMFLINLYTVDKLPDDTDDFLTVTQDLYKGFIGHEVTIRAFCKDGEIKRSDMNWEISNDNVLELKPGIITFKKVGSSSLTIEYQQFFKTIHFTVLQEKDIDGPVVDICVVGQTKVG